MVTAILRKDEPTKKERHAAHWRKITLEIQQLLAKSIKELFSPGVQKTQDVPRLSKSESQLKPKSNAHSQP